MTSKKQQNSGFLLPNPVTGYDTVCLTLQIPNVREYRAAIVGHLYKLGNWWTWDKTYTPGDERAKQAAAMWRRLLAETLQINECGYEPPGGDPVATGCVPVGWIISTATAATPDGFLPCDGETYLRVDYPDLYAALDSHLILDADHFQTPTIKDGRAPVGVGSYQVWRDGANATIPVVVGGQVGEYQHRLNADELAVHSHDRNPNAYPEYGLRYGASGSYGFGSGSAPALSNIQSTGSAGGNKYHNNVGPGTGLRFFIRATDCNTIGMENFDMRLDGCILQYTFNGSMWFVVDGWTTFPTCITHPETGQTFDLRFNNCNLEWSKDSAQTWDTVPGWSSMAACFPDAWTPDDFNMRVEDGVLQYTEDGGDNWNPVFGWNTLQDNFLKENARCQNAWGVAWGFKQIAWEMANVLVSTPTLGEYVTHCQQVWNDHFGPVGTYPIGLTNFASATFNDDSKEQLIDEFRNPQYWELLAQYIFSANLNGEWCGDEADIIGNYHLCYTLPAWVQDIFYLITGLFEATDSEYLVKVRAWLYQMRDFGTCQTCNLIPLDPCPDEPQDWLCVQPMTSGMGAWVQSQVDGGTVSQDSYGLKFHSDNSIYHVMEIERPINGVGVSMTVVGKSQSTYQAADERVIFLARVGGSWQTITYWQHYSNATFTHTTSIPANCDAVRIRLYSSQDYTFDMWIGSATVIINTVNDPC